MTGCDRASCGGQCLDLCPMVASVKDTRPECADSFPPQLTEEGHFGQPPIVLAEVSCRNLCLANMTYLAM